MIDTHVHFWQLERGDYTWITADRSILCRDFLPQEFSSIVSTTEVTQCIAVQAAPTVAETIFLLELSHTYSFIGGVTGWVDLTSLSVTDDLRQLKQKGKLKAIRPMTGFANGEQWLLNDKYRTGLSALTRHGLVLEALAAPGHLNAIAEVASKYTNLNIIINHAAKPMPDEFAQWVVSIKKFKSLINVYCKLSGLNQLSTDFSYQANIVDELLNVFGPRRMLWGSDFPVLLESSDYCKWISRSNSLLKQLSSEEKEQIQTATAKTLYQL